MSVGKRVCALHFWGGVPFNFNKPNKYIYIILYIYVDI